MNTSNLDLTTSRGFANAVEMTRKAVSDTFSPGMMMKFTEVINNVCDIIDEIRKQKEKMEGENEKRDLPPTPPIESKEKEEGEKKEHTHNARAREEALRINREADEVFNAFWAKYPVGHKTAKKKSREAFRIRYRDAKDKANFVNEFLGGLDRWLASKRWSEGFVVNPYTFIYQERWRDTPEPSKQSLRENDEKASKAREAAAAEALKGLGL